MYATGRSPRPLTERTGATTPSAILSLFASMHESAFGVRREKAALSSGCKPQPATAPAGNNRSSHGGNEVAVVNDTDINRRTTVLARTAKGLSRRIEAVDDESASHPTAAIRLRCNIRRSGPHNRTHAMQQNR